MSGNSERPRVAIPNDYYGLRIFASDIIYYMERKDLIGSITSLNGIITLASLMGMKGTEHQLEGLARFVRLIICEKYGGQVAYGDGWIE